MSNRIENYPNIEKLQTILNELAFHQIHQAWIDKKIPQYSLIILERWAEFYPNTIKNLGMSDLMTLALPQAQMELEILESVEADKKREQGANRHGDTSRRANQSQSIHSNRTPNLFSFVSRNDDERQGTDRRRNNQRSVLETETRINGYERKNLKSGRKLDFVSDDEVYLGSLKDRFQKNLQAIKLSKIIKQENRYATKQEQEILNKFSG